MFDNDFGIMNVRHTKTSQERLMKRVMIIAAAVALSATACAEPDPSILVTGHVPLSGSADEEGGVTDCSAPGSLSDVELVSGSVFVNLEEVEAAGVPFSIGLLMENRLVDSSTYRPIGYDQNQRLNMNHIEIQGYEGTFDSGTSGFSNLGDGGQLRFESTGILQTDGALWVGLELFYPNEISRWREAFDIASGGQGNAIVPTFLEVQVLGETVGGSKAQSNVLTVPVQICDGCSRASTPICVATGG